jgi:hypothetical protein
MAMLKPDWYSQIMLTAIAALLLVTAGELQFPNQLSVTASCTA